ncbi:MAG: hypothetical protein Ct9H300mP23_12370 [Nitrospinota bacterium]|nr:MAG: hypothetical protein Ct9H300mP23_12370 [Nitrospinota bacterium]
MEFNTIKIDFIPLILGMTFLLDGLCDRLFFAKVFYGISNQRSGSTPSKNYRGKPRKKKWKAVLK